MNDGIEKLTETFYAHFFLTQSAQISVGMFFLVQAQGIMKVFVHLYEIFIFG